MPPNKNDFSDFENFLLRKIDQLFKKFDNLSTRITRMEEQLKAVTSNRWTPGQWALVLSALIGAFGAVVVAFVR